MPHIRAADEASAAVITGPAAMIASALTNTADARTRACRPDGKNEAFGATQDGDVGRAECLSGCSAQQGE
jgi:hypothetical protein